jgi:hypothetical protein
MRNKILAALVTVLVGAGFGAVPALMSTAHGAVLYLPPTVHVSDISGASSTISFNGTMVGSDHLVTVSGDVQSQCVYMGAYYGYWWNCPGVMQWEVNLRDGADVVSGVADQHVHVFANTSDADDGTVLGGNKQISIGSNYGSLKVEGGTGNDSITLTRELVYPSSADGGPGNDTIRGIHASNPLQSTSVDTRKDDLNGGKGADVIFDWDNAKDTINCGYQDGAKDTVFRDKNTVTDALTNCGNDTVKNNTETL